jgi:3-oxoacyl-[acyl-carrier protein] reductase
VERLTGRVAFVTGGNTGIGAAVCRRLASEGARVVVAFLEEPAAASALVDELTSGGRPALAVRCDVTDADSVESAFARAHELGPPHVLVNNAAVLARGPFLETSDEAFDRAIDVALRGTVRCCRAALPGLLETRGAIVNVSSELVALGGTGHAAYVAAKAGVVGVTRALAKEFGSAGVRVNAVAPGSTRTRMLDASAIGDAALAAIPLGRVGEPEDVAAAVAFLASDDASWITGQVLGVNGGLAMT